MTNAKDKALGSKFAGRVLLLEDDDLLAEKIEGDFKRLGIRCLIADRIEGLAERFQKENVHALVTDVYVNSKTPNGLDAVRQASSLGIPSIIITASLDKEVAKQGLNMGASSLLEKPFETKELLRNLEDIWENPKGLIGIRERFLDTHFLTEKEKELARLVLKGLSNSEIAEVAGTTVSTVKFYTHQIFSKCDVQSRTELFNMIFPT